MLKMLFPSKYSTVAQLTPTQLYEQMKVNEQMVMLDVRSPEEFAYDGHIAGSRLMPLPVLGTRSHELPKDKPIICVCRSGARSQAACESLEQQGFTVINLSGGMIAWKQAGLPTK